MGARRRQRGATLVYGRLAPEASGVRVTLDGGEIVEPELQGGPRREFVVGFEAARRVRQAESFDADGRLLASFPDGEAELGFPDGTRSQGMFVLQGR